MKHTFRSSRLLALLLAVVMVISMFPVQAFAAGQTILERLGWRFIRIRGSEYHRDPKRAMDRVFRELEAHGIHPDTAGPERKPDTDLLARVKAHAQPMLGNTPS